MGICSRTNYGYTLSMLKSLARPILSLISIFLLGTVLCAAQSISPTAPANPILPHADPFITLHPIHGRYLLLATTGRNITLWSGTTIPTASTDSKIVFTPSEPLEQHGR